MDKIISYFSANNIKHQITNKFLIYSEIDKEKEINIIYHLESKTFYIDKKDYFGQPHIIQHWNIENDENKFGLCLTLDGKDRRTSNFTTFNKIQRINQIVFEKWSNPTAERFKELNVIFKTKKLYTYFINQNNEICWNSNDKENIIDKFEKIDIEYKGETFEELYDSNKIKSKIEKNILLQINFGNEIKKVFIPSNSELNFKLNDLSRIHNSLCSSDQNLLIILNTSSSLINCCQCQSSIRTIYSVNYLLNE